MPIKVENRSSIAVKNLEEQIERVFACVPVEHVRGFGRVVVVDKIEDPRLPVEQTEKLPVLYRPKSPGQSTASGELALGVLFPADANFFKKFLAKAQLKQVIAQLVLTLVAQHYLITIASKRKRGGEIERAARDYVEKYFRVWRDQNAGRRARLFKPFVPYLEKLQRSVRKAEAERRRSAS